MIVARFTSATGWAGKSITYDSGQFALEGYGPLAAQDVLQYDQQGQIAWEYEGLREWVGQVAAGATSSPAASGFPAQSTSAGTTRPLFYGYAADAQYFEVNKLPSPPSIAVAGFMLSILGFIFPVLVWWWVGLPLSWSGHKKAVREQLPTGLAMAGLIINAVMTVLSVLFLLVVIVLVATR
jgi:hypothetical protein